MSSSVLKLELICQSLWVVSFSAGSYISSAFWHSMRSFVCSRCWNINAPATEYATTIPHRPMCENKNFKVFLQQFLALLLSSGGGGGLDFGSWGGGWVCFGGGIPPAWLGGGFWGLPGCCVPVMSMAVAWGSGPAGFHTRVILMDYNSSINAGGLHSICTAANTETRNKQCHIKAKACCLH